jgi:hypothetical protein
MNLTPEQILEKIMAEPIDAIGFCPTVNYKALASYLASIQPKEEMCPTTVPQASLLSIPRPKGWRVGQTLYQFKTWLADKKDTDGSDIYVDGSDIFYIDDSDLDRYYQEFLRTIK